MYTWLETIQWAQPWVLLCIPIAWLLYFWRRPIAGRVASISLITLQRLPARLAPTPWVHRLARLAFLLSITCLLAALAGPREGFTERKLTGKGIDIVLCFDISGSMLERDFLPNRLEAAKEVARQFIKQRSGDRVGITIFSSQSFTLCPLTTDAATLLQQVDVIESGYLQDDGTAIGSGLATSVDRLRSSESKSRVVILLTDGVDFGGQIPPDKARDMAKLYKVKVYTVGMGTVADTDEIVQTETGPMVRKKRMEFNEPLLKNIAQTTGGRYFHAKDQATLEKIYESINQLEKSDIKIQKSDRYTLWWPALAKAALMFAALGVLLRYILGRTVV